MINHRDFQDRATRSRVGAMAFSCAALLTACDSVDRLLEVDAPSRVIGVGLEDPSQSVLVLRSVQATFECAFGAYVLTTGMVGDELANAQATVSSYPYDQRTFTSVEGAFATYARADCWGSGALGIGVYTPVSSARWYADRATEALEGWTDAEVAGRQSAIATTALYAGFSLVLMGEGFCSSTVDLGPELSRQQLFTLAEARFTKALTAAQASGNTAILNAARAGRARARRNLDRLPDAAADAALVPRNFVFNMTAETAPIQRENRVYDWINFRPGATVDVPFRNLTWQGVADPRVPVFMSALRHGPLNENRWMQNKYTAQGSPIAIASWDEAQLIIAEAAIERGDLATAVGIINTLHTNVGLAGYAGGTAAEVRAQLIDERKRELFLEGHRLWDIVRYRLPLYPVSGAVFPYGGFYGGETCFPLPDREKDANPNV